MQPAFVGAPQPLHLVDVWPLTRPWITDVHNPPSLRNLGVFKSWCEGLQVLAMLHITCSRRSIDWQQTPWRAFWWKPNLELRRIRTHLRILSSVRTGGRYDEDTEGEFREGNKSVTQCYHGDNMSWRRAGYSSGTDSDSDGGHDVAPWMEACRQMGR